MLVTDTATIQRYYQALLDRDPSYTGIFYVAVKTTAIFCIATCRARKPKFENVEFYTSFEEPIKSGFRPCKVCKPAENASQMPPTVERAISLIREQGQQKVSDADLKQHGISPEQVRRWFKQHYGMTFQKFQRMHRISSASQALSQGKKVTDSAFDSGYDSLSGFGYSYKKMLGAAPTHSNTEKVILISRLTTPLGPMLICATNLGICLLEFVDRKNLQREIASLEQLLQCSIISGENTHIEQAKQQVAEYFSGDRQVFDVHLDLQGSEFQKRAWRQLLQLTYGCTVSYQQQAVAMNRATAVRAVASANAKNKIAIIVPCHRVLAKNGHLTGYAGGLERKRWLLEHELANHN